MQASARGPLFATIMVAAGALLTGLVGFVFVLQGAPSLPRALVLPDPIGWAIGPHMHAMPLLAMIVALVILAGLTWLFTRLVVRSAMPGRGAAVFFGTWGAIVVAALVSGIVRAPLLMASFGYPAAMVDVLPGQFFQFATQGATWALFWGWITALVVMLVHRASGGAPHGPEQMAYRHAEYRHAGDQPPYAPPAQQYPPQQYPPQAPPQPYAGPHIPPQPPTV